MKRTAIKRRGRKTLKWEQARSKLNIAFAAAGITSCECGYSGCWREFTLGYAHSRKRADIRTPEQLLEVILACSANCHPVLEAMPKPKMERTVKAIIAKRSVPVRL